MNTTLIKKITLITVVFIILGAAGYKLLLYADNTAEENHKASSLKIERLSADQIAQLKEGNFILRRGFGFFSDYISKHLNKGNIDVTHAGIIVRHGGRLMVIHSLSSNVSLIDGVQLQPLEEFLQYSAPGKIIVTKAKNADALTGHKIALLAEHYLQKKIPFDHNGKFDDDTELFCTELIWKILEQDLHYSKLPADPESRKKFFYSMQPMYDSEYFDILINDFK